MGRPRLDRAQLTAQIPKKLFQSIRSDAVNKGYTVPRDKSFRVDWQGYLVELFSLVITEKIEIPRKGVDRDI